MITLTPTLFAALFMAMVLLPIIRVFGVSKTVAHGVQAIGLFILGYVAFQVSFISFWGSCVLIATPIIFLVIRVSHTALRGFRALRGDYGEKTKWVAEYIKEDDAEFTWALKQLNQMQMKEIQIEADTKQELKELAVERASQ